MKHVSRWFLRAAVCWVIVGMSLGIAMAASGDHRLHSLHAHINLLGWVTMALFGLFLQVFPQAAASRQATWLFWWHNAALVVMTPALAALYLGYPEAEPFAALSGFMLLGGMALFAMIVFRATRA